MILYFCIWTKFIWPPRIRFLNFWKIVDLGNIDWSWEKGLENQKGDNGVNKRLDWTQSPKKLNNFIKIWRQPDWGYKFYTEDEKFRRLLLTLLLREEGGFSKPPHLSEMMNGECFLLKYQLLKGSKIRSISSDKIYGFHQLKDSFLRKSRQLKSSWLKSNRTYQVDLIMLNK